MSGAGSMCEEGGRELVAVRGLKKSFPVRFKGRRGWIRAVDGIRLSIFQGETVGLVGESGCGKSTVARLLLRLLDPDEGTLLFDSQDILALRGRDLTRYRRDVQLVFQDPYSSLNPRMTIGKAVEEPLLSHGLLGKKEARERARELLEFMGISPSHYFRYPHEFSGGQRQRIVIARALALNPRFLVADEPLSALDVSIQAQILHVLEEIKEQFRMTYLFISHDLAVVRHISDRVAVMYLGRIVELAETESLYQDPLHPYTRALLDAVPVNHPRLKRKRTPIPGEVPSPLNPPTGCPFHPRCSLRMERCSRDVPALMEPQPEHEVACFVYGDLSVQPSTERRKT